MYRILKMGWCALFIVSLSSSAMASGGWVKDRNSGCKVWFSHPRSSMTITWSGACRDGKANGKGILQIQNDRKDYGRFKGDLLDGKLHGFGKYVSERGYTYEGQFKNSKKDGQGKFIWADGKIYDGLYQDDKRSGQGTMLYSNGESWTGEWRNDNKFKATVSPPKNSLKSVTVSGADIPEHKRCKSMHSGMCYVGDKVRGEWHGYGTLYQNGKKRYVGQFSEGMFHGKGTLYQAGNDHKQYEGTFRENEMTGSAKLFRQDGTVQYIGAVSEAEPHGDGTLYNSDGTKLKEGSFAHGRFVSGKTFKKSNESVPEKINVARYKGMAPRGGLALNYPDKYIIDTLEEITKKIKAQTGLIVTGKQAIRMFDSIANPGRKLELYETENGFLVIREDLKKLPLMNMLDVMQAQMYKKKADVCKSGYSDGLCKESIRNLQFSVLVANRLNATSTLKNKRDFPRIINEGLLAYTLYKNYEPNKISKLYDGVLGEMEKSFSRIEKALSHPSTIDYMLNLNLEEKVAIGFGIAALATKGSFEIMKKICSDGGCEGTTPSSSIRFAPIDQCQTHANLRIEVNGDLEGSPRFDITPPQGSSFKGGGGFLFSNTNSDSGSVSGNCIGGKYNFSYSYDNQGNRKEYTGVFYLDGWKSSYQIIINQAGVLEGPTVRVLQN